MRASAALRVVDRAFGEGRAARAMQHLAARGQRAGGRLHERGFHFDGDDAHGLVHAARRRRQGHVEPGHQRTAVGDVERVEVLGLGGETQLGLAVVKKHHLETQVFDERDVGAKTFLHHRPHSTSNTAAAPMPPPMHIVTPTRLAPRRLPSMWAWPVKR